MNKLIAEIITHPIPAYTKDHRVRININPNKNAINFIVFPPFKLMITN